MNQCPKCNSINISRPIYRQEPYSHAESLLYVCRNCGYQENRPCADAHPKKEAPP